MFRISSRSLAFSPRHPRPSHMAANVMPPCVEFHLGPLPSVLVILVLLILIVLLGSIGLLFRCGLSCASEKLDLRLGLRCKLIRRLLDDRGLVRRLARSLQRVCPAFLDHGSHAQHHLLAVFELTLSGNPGLASRSARKGCCLAEECGVRLERLLQHCGIGPTLLKRREVLMELGKRRRFASRRLRGGLRGGRRCSRRLCVWRGNC